MIDAVKQRGNRGRCQLIVLIVFIFLICSIILVVGIATFTGRKSHAGKKPKPILAFIKKVKDEWFRLYPSKVAFDPEVDEADIFELFQPYDPIPSAIKLRTDKALELQKEFNMLTIDHSKLKPRERKGIAQVKHFIGSTFGNPFGENYYAGDWMMGPNYYCYNEICSIGDDFKHNYYVKPKSAKDLENLMTALKRIELVFERYTRNMLLGVKAGMVRAVEDCKASRNAFKMRYKKIAAIGRKGVIEEKFTEDLISSEYYDKVPLLMLDLFEVKYGMRAEEKIADVLINYVGTPIENFITFLESNYSRYCVPSYVTSGLANLPLKHVWLDQKKTSSKTSERLPTGELLSGRRTYESILYFFLTSKLYTPAKIQKLGETYLERLYVNAVNLAMKITNKNRTEALSEFIRDLNDERHFFNNSVIPNNENGEEGAKKCHDMDSAKVHCPIRYEAMKRWFQFAEMILAKIEPKTVNLFYITGKYATTPNCPIEMRANFNPSVGSQSFDASGPRCFRPGYYNLPFFMQRPGPIYNAFSVAGHEGRPGHSTQVQGKYEHFWISGRGDVIDWLNMVTQYTVFVEGWALYAENPLLAKDTDLYSNNRLQEYGMLKWQLWRALRLIIDTGLHVRGMTIQDGKDLFKKYCWDTTDKAHKDVIRYMSLPGQATAYMIGQLEIWKMRNATEKRLKDNNKKFSLREFHFQVLSQGSCPLEYLQEHIENYIECKIDSDTHRDCKEILDPSIVNKEQESLIGIESRWNYIRNNLPHSHHLE